MHTCDPRDLSQSSQSLDDVISLFDGLYKYSPLPFCIRGQSRNILYKNDAYSDFFHPLSKSYSGVSFEPDEVELDLSTIEFEAFVMGADTAVCRTFIFNGEFYQLRIEIRCIDDEMYAFWFINFFPDYQALFQTSCKIKSDTFDIDVFLSEMTTKKMVALCFSMLGFQIHSISRFLGVSETAVSNRMAVVKVEIKKYFPDYDEFRVFCLRNNVYQKMVAVVLNVLNVNFLSKK